MRNVVSLLVALQLVTVGPPPPRAAVLVGFDASASVPPAEFAVYPEIVRTVALPLLRPGDELVLVRLDQPGDPPEAIRVDRRLSRVQNIKTFYERVQQVKSSRGPHVTDVGIVLDHMRRRIELDRTMKVRTAPSYLAVAVTDGVKAGRQTEPRDALEPVRDADWRVVFIGIKADTEDALRQAAVRAGFADSSRMLFVPFSHWRELAPSLPRFFGRTVNASIVSALEPSSRESRR